MGQLEVPTGSDTRVERRGDHQSGLPLDRSATQGCNKRGCARDATVPERRSKARHEVKTLLPGQTDTH